MSHWRLNGKNGCAISRITSRAKCIPSPDSSKHVNLHNLQYLSENNNFLDICRTHKDTMLLSRIEKPYFLLFLVFSQLLFILLLYRRGATSMLQGVFGGSYTLWDYSKTQDVYTNLSLLTPDPDTVNTQYCPIKSPILVGPITVTFNKLPSLKKVLMKNPYVKSGGYFSPKHCFGRYRTAVIIPHRSRETHLQFLLYYLHPFLQRQQLHYAIFVVHQAGNATFNRAKLLNIGVREALRLDEWDCLILHDVDLVPENDYNLYICDEDYPKHLASAMDKFQYSLPYWTYFGGVSALTPAQYMRINGFPNTYWGWGGEDDDIAMRHDLLKKTRTTWKEDGMNSLAFKLLSRKETPLYTNITVDIGDMPVMPVEKPKWKLF
ncbi:beta-1,4-galactosyltransferase 3-like isoform X2 [Ascaphus truei]|uniref:beta-1,4-galactosyltransferase 3-like isoform X2 n=1 Tax=Ascaphus truei TaxID=8439 RepID=UPI003F5ADC8F